MLRLLAVATACIGLAACSYLHPYRPNIEQGNIITAKNASQLHVGMTSAQVTKLMGEPILRNSFDDNLVVYAYQYLPNNGTNVKKTITVYLRRGRVSRIEKS